MRWKLFLSHFFLFFGIFYICNLKCCGAQFNDVSNKVFPATLENAFVASFADVDGDKHIDLFLIKGGNEAVILTKNSKEFSFFKTWQTTSFNINSTIVSLLPADFNGDGLTDVAITTKELSSTSLYLCFGKNGKMLSTTSVLVLSNIKDEPLLLDANGDMIPDLFVILQNNSRRFLLGHQSPVGVDWHFHNVDFMTNEDILPYMLRVPHSCAFVDLDGDHNAELFVTTVNEGCQYYEIWKGSASGLNRINLIPFNKGTYNMEIGQSVFVDLNGDSYQDHLIPICELVENSCNNSKILMQNGNDFVEVFVSVNNWNFISQKSSHKQQPITLVTGDYNLDSYFDVLCVMQNSQESDSSLWQTVILYGKPCSNEFCRSVGYEFDLSLVLPNSEGSFSSSFFDLYNDGSLDILASIIDKDGLYLTKAYENTVSEDASFLFIKVLSGKTKTDSNVAGVTVSYSTTNTMGGMLQTSATQLAQSAHLSLQLPYVCFGLGRLPNFVDKLVVTLPSCLLPKTFCTVPYSGNYTSYEKTWTMIIPNSQMFVIPYPPNDSSKWSNKLLVTPGHNLLDTLAVLVATCAAITIAIVILHCMERKQDRQEKIQEAHRFHFDAM